eukprot:COSAG06_NODE_711_length_12877_cov_16.318281_5_plen_83_part_00
MTEESTQHKQNTVYLCRSSATALVLSPLLASLLLYPLMLLLAQPLGSHFNLNFSFLFRFILVYSFRFCQSIFCSFQPKLWTA